MICVKSVLRGRATWAETGSSASPDGAPLRRFELHQTEFGVTGVISKHNIGVPRLGGSALH